MKLTNWLWILLLVGALQAWGAAEPGGPAPGFVLTMSSGGSASLDQFRGRPAVLWFTTLSPSVQSSVKPLVDLISGRGSLLVVSQDGPDAATAQLFSQSYGLPVLLDGDGQVSRTYAGEYISGTSPLRNLFIVNSQGIVQVVRRYPGTPPRVLEGDFAQLR